MGSIGHSIGHAFGGITDAIGLTNHSGERAAAGAAKDATRAQKELGDRSLDMSEESIKFQREQYGDWKDIYGNMQEQISDYYNNYDASDVIANRLAQIDQQYNQQGNQLTRELSQRGLGTSGLEARGLTQLSQGEAAQKSAIRNSAADEAINKKMQFLGLGLGQGSQMLGINAQVANNGVNAAMGLAGQNAQMAGQQSALQGQLGVAGMHSMSQVTTQAIKSIGDFMGGKALMGSDYRLKNNIKLIKSIGKYDIYTWDWNTEGNKLGYSGSDTGVIAQDVLEIKPEAVTERDGYLFIDKSRLPKAIQKEITYE